MLSGVAHQSFPWLLASRAARAIVASAAWLSQRPPRPFTRSVVVLHWALGRSAADPPVVLSELAVADDPATLGGLQPQRHVAHQTSRRIDRRLNLRQQLRLESVTIQLRRLGHFAPPGTGNYKPTRIVHFIYTSRQRSLPDTIFRRFGCRVLVPRG